MTLHFAQPLWLVAGAIAALLLAWALHRAETRRRAALAQFASPRLTVQLTSNFSSRRRLIKNIALVLALLTTFVTLARPQYGYRLEEVKRRGIDLLFAIDTSRSMQAEDVQPDRLTRARLGIYDFVHQLGGDRIGLLPFAGDSWLMCPLTLDYNAFDQSLESIDTSVIPRGGTNITGMIDNAVEILGNGSNQKILIIITDGENLEGNAITAAKAAATAGVTIYTVGVGTPAGELIPLRRGQGVVRNAAGKPVRSRLDAKSLVQIAEATGGIYAPLGKNGEGLQTIYQKKLALVPKAELAGRRRQVPRERFQWPLAATLFLLLVEFCISERRRQRSSSQVAALLLLCVFTLPGVGHAAETPASPAVQSTSHHVKNEPQTPQLQYNAGTDAYKEGQLDAAIDHFTRSLDSRNLSLQEKAYYNRGMAQFRKGAQQLHKEPKATINEWEQAVKSFETAVKLDPLDRDAAENLASLRQQLKKLKQQQKKREDKKKKKQQKKQKQSNEKSRSQNQPNQDRQQDKQQNGSDKKQSHNQRQRQEQQKNTADKNSQDSKKDKDSGGNNNTSKDSKGQKKKKDQKGSKETKRQQQSGQNQSRKQDDKPGSTQKNPAGTTSQEQQKPTPQPGQNGQQKQAKKADGKSNKAPQPAGPQPAQPAAPKQGKQQNAAPAGSASAGQQATQQTGQAAKRAAALQAANEDKARRAAGKMTRGEALRLLKAVKGETDTLQFVPAPSTTDPKRTRDW